jgi:uncharacterized protein YbaP (TraB family)
MLKYLIPLLVLPFCSLFSESSVWKVSKGRKSFYIGGTCHALRPSDYPLPYEFDYVYSRTDTLVFEMDPSVANDPNFTFQLLRASSYDKERSLETILSRKTYEMLAEKCKQSGLPVERFNKTKPTMVMMLLMVEELTKIGATEKGVEIYYHKKALEDQKPMLALETAEFQIELVASLGEGIENTMIYYGLKDIENFQSNFDMLVEAWKEGDIIAIDRYFVEGLREFPQIYAKLLISRNKQWLSSLEEFINTPEIEFVLVGAAHMAGEYGLISLLENKGYKVEQVHLSKRKLRNRKNKHRR